VTAEKLVLYVYFEQVCGFHSDILEDRAPQMAGGLHMTGLLT